MKESGVGVFARLTRCAAFAAIALLVGAGTLHAQSTGKLEGRVRDQAGAPIPGAQVRIEGTAATAVADGRGYYFFNNVVPGQVSLLAQFVGYKPVRVMALRVLAGQTITQDFALEQQAVDIGEIEVVGAQNVLVPRDEVTTKQRLNGDFVDKLPVDRIANVLALQPGVVADPRGGNLNIRGGRTDEAATYIDGVPVSGGNRGTASMSRTGGIAVARSNISVGTNAFEEASVTTGASSAEFGNAQSGIINIQTRSGGSKWAGSASWETDAPFGVNHGPGFNRIEASIGGPIAKALTFAFSAALEGRRGFDNGFDAQKTPEFVVAGVDTTVRVVDANGNASNVDIPRFAIGKGECSAFRSAGAAGLNGAGAAAIRDIRGNYGLDCTGVRTPYTPRGTLEGSAKLTYSFGTGSRVSVSGIVSQNQSRLSLSGAAGGGGSNTTNAFVLAPQLNTAQQLRSQVYILNWSQNLSKSSERALTLETYLSYQEDRTQQGNLTSQGELDTRGVFGGFLVKPLDFAWDFNNFPITRKIINDFRDGTGPASPVDPTGVYSENTAYFLNPYGVKNSNGFYKLSSGSAIGDVSNLRLSRERRYIGKANLDWQIDRYNRMKFGGEYTRYKIVHYNRTPADQNLTCFCDAYIESPIRYDLFAENTLDLGDVVVVGGLRYDYYDSKASHPFNPDSGYQFPYTGRSNPGAAFYKRDKSHNYLSPHVQVSFPVTEKTNFRLSYAHQVQAPDFSLVYAGINTDIKFTNGNQLYGTDLDFAKTVTFEFGIRHAFSEDMVLDLALYNKNKLSDVSARQFKNLVGFDGVPQEIFFYTNADFGTVRGIDVRVDRRIGSLFNGTLAYTYQNAKSTGTNPASTVSYFAQLPSASGIQNTAPQSVLNTTDSRPHNLAGAAAINFPNDWHKGSTIGTILQNTGLTATFRYSSGTPYTACPAGDQASLNAAVISGGVCASPVTGSQDLLTTRLPAYKQFDLKVTRGFALGGLDLTVYGDFRNLFNFRNTLNVFAATGTTSNPVDFANFFGNDSSNTAAEALKNAGVYGANASVDLSAVNCDSWTSATSGASGPVNCVSIRRAEQRFGNGDGVYTVAEQRRASRARYDTIRGSIANFLDLPRRIRVGMEISF